MKQTIYWGLVIIMVTLALFAIHLVLSVIQNLDLWQVYLNNPVTMTGLTLRILAVFFTIVAIVGFIARKKYAFYAVNVSSCCHILLRAIIFVPGVGIVDPGLLPIVMNIVGIFIFLFIISYINKNKENKLFM